MTPRIELFGWSVLGLLAVSAFVLMIGAPDAEAQMGNISGPPDTPPDSVDNPGFLDFCVGDRCPGQTCDELNDRCVGNVTMQPAMGEPLLGLTQTQLDRFNAGAVAFDRTFVVDEGLGPVFNQDSCGSCHNQPLGGSGTITVLRFGHRDFDAGTFDPLADLGGSLWNRESISPECSEIIPVPPTNWAASRVTNSTLGFGLVEAIRDQDIEFNAINPPPGISGRVHLVPVLESPGLTKVGRFGWKDQLATVLSFTADAMVEEMGITSRIFPEDNAPNNDLVKLAACDAVADPEDIPDADGNEFLDLTTDFQRFLAPPPQTPKSGMTGEAIFDAIGCADCHMTGFEAFGDDETEDAIAGQTVNAYSDFLLHDMGENADFIEQGGASMTEIRTTLLWGLRVRDPLWHDGRVAGGDFQFRINNAIALHDSEGSEAQASAQLYAALSPGEQMQVIQFLDSLGRREFDMDGDGDVDDGDVLIIDDCAAIDVEITPDHLCAIADVDQNGLIDQADLDLLGVALGILDDDDVCICHIPPGDPDNAHTICISPNAVDAHLQHGDTLGPCDDDDEGDDVDPRSMLDSSNPRDSGGLMDMSVSDDATPFTTHSAPVDEDEARRQRRLDRRKAGRRGQ